MNSRVIYDSKLLNLENLEVENDSGNAMHILGSLHPRRPVDPEYMDGSDKEFAIRGKQKDSVREETNIVSGTMKISVQNRYPKPLHPLSHQHKEVEVRRGKRAPVAGVHLGSSLDSRAKTS